MRRRHRSTAFLAGTAIALGLLTACGGTTTADPDADTSFDPCSSLDADDISTLGFDSATWTDVSMGEDGPRGCRATNEVETMTLMVVDAAASTIYASEVAPWAGNDVGTSIDRYRFTQANACAALVYAGSSVVIASASDDAEGPLDPAAGDAMCAKAMNILKRAGGGLEAPSPDPEFSLTDPASDEIGYVQLLQAGSLRTRSMSGSDLTVVDKQGRLLPYSKLTTLDPDDPDAGMRAAAELTGELWQW